MIRLRRRPRREEPVEINISPLIDLMFLLLIFFITTASFMRETGITVERPIARTAREKKASLLVGVDREGRIYIGGNEVRLEDVRTRVEAFLSENPGGSIMIVADRRVPTGLLVKVMDECRLSGAKVISLAASKGI